MRTYQLLTIIGSILLAPTGPVKRLDAAECIWQCISSLELPRSTAGLPRSWLPDGVDGTVIMRFEIDDSGDAAPDAHRT